MRFILVSLFLIILSCENKELLYPPANNSLQASEDYLTAENIFTDVGFIVKGAFFDNGISRTSYPVYIKNDLDTTNADTLIIDFGSKNTLFKNKLRRGRIISVYSGDYLESNAIISTYFDQYYSNNNLIEGTRVIENKGINPDGNMWFLITVIEASITTINGVIDWQSNQSREWVAGSSTLSNMFDDQYLISGTSFGNGVNGNGFTTNINKPLLLDLSCYGSSPCLITNGQTIINPDNYSDRIINYGDSLCDCIFEISINENSDIITLP